MHKRDTRVLISNVLCHKLNDPENFCRKQFFKKHSYNPFLICHILHYTCTCSFDNAYKKIHTVVNSLTSTESLPSTSIILNTISNCLRGSKQIKEEEIQTVTLN